MNCRGIVLAVCLFTIALPILPVVPSHIVNLASEVGIASLVTLGLVVLTGVGGMTSFAQAVFVGFGAYTTAVLTTTFGWSAWATLVPALLVTAIGALIIGAATVRLSGHFVALGTLAWAISVYYLFGSLPMLGQHTGISSIPALSIGGFSLTNPRLFYPVVWMLVVGCTLLTINLLDSRVGRAVRALRRGGDVAQAFGVNSTLAKLGLFIYAALLAGLSGWLLTHFERSISPSLFGIDSGIEYLLMAVLGGAGYVFGAIVGSTIVVVLREQLQVYLPQLLGHTGNFETVVFGCVLLLVLFAGREGLWPLLLRSVGSLSTSKPIQPAAMASRPMPECGTELLSVEGLTKRFGGLVAVDDVSFSIRAGEITGLIGPNGAGKSTTFNLLTGVQSINAGTIRFFSRVLSSLTPPQAARLGIGRTFQHAKLIAGMSVLDNVALGAHLRGKRGALAAILRLNGNEERRLLGEAALQIERVGLAELMHRAAGSLSLGQLRLVEIARALALDPVLLLLDEPAAGLRYHEKVLLAKLLRQLSADGMAVLLVEHDMDFVMNLVDHLVVLDFGAKIADGIPLEVSRDPAVLAAYLGGRKEDSGATALVIGQKKQEIVRPVLSVRDLSVSYGKVEAVRSVSLDIQAGTIVTVIGANGAGKSTLLNAIMGLLPAKGSIALDGNEQLHRPAAARVSSGIALVPEQRQLFGSMSVEDNLVLGAYKLRGSGTLKYEVANIYDRFPRLKERRRQMASTLSGGERQMLAMGRALMSRPHLLMLDEPSLGLAPRIVIETLQIVVDLQQTGVSTLLIEQNARAALEIADYGYVMELGEVTRQGSGRMLLADNKIIESYLGSHAVAANAAMKQRGGGQRNCSNER